MRSYGCLAFAVLLIAPVLSIAAEDGKQSFNNRCRTCHSMNEGDNRQGPSLHGIVGRKAAGSEGYASYSQALANSDIVWDEQTLDRFIENPDAVVPGHNMRPYAGLPDKNERQRIIAYLSSASSNASAATE